MQSFGFVIAWTTANDRLHSVHIATVEQFSCQVTAYNNYAEGFRNNYLRCSSRVGPILDVGRSRRRVLNLDVKKSRH